MSDSSAPNNKNSSNTDDNHNNNNQKKWRFLPKIIKLIFITLIILLTILSILFYALGTDKGTQFIIEKIINETKIYVGYHKGNFRDGLQVTEIHIPINDKLDIKIEQASLKIGWRALFNQHIHLREAKINRIYIKNKSKSSGKPFSYPDINLPTILTIDKAIIDRIVYDQVDSIPLVFKEVNAENLQWKGTRLDIGDADLTFSYINKNKLKNNKTNINKSLTHEPSVVDESSVVIVDEYGVAHDKIDTQKMQDDAFDKEIFDTDTFDRDVVRLENTHGNVNFTLDYPIDATSIVTVFDVTKHYVDDVELSATGSLKNLHGKLKSKYNKTAIRGEIDIEPMISGSPFTAHLTSDDTLIPYAKAFDIKLKKPVIDIKGTWKKMAIAVTSELQAKNIPSGNYKTKLTLDTVKGQLDVNSLSSETKKGDITADATIKWDKNIWIKAQVTSDHYQLDEVVPEEWKDYQGYLPKALNGTLDFKYLDENLQGSMQIDTRLVQNDGEYLTARIIRMNNPHQYDNAKHHKNNQNKKNQGKQKQQLPYSITANWKNLYRKIPKKLDIHKLEIIDSDKGSVNLFVQGGYLQADIDCSINKLSLAPKGDYNISLELQNNQLDISKLVYQGDIGQLSGTAKVSIPQDNNKNSTNKDPIIWSIIGQSSGLYPQKYNQSIPIKKITGKFSISDEMYFDNPEQTKQSELITNKILASVNNTNNKSTTKKNQQYHKLAINNANVVATMTDSRQIDIVGSANIDVDVNDTKLTAFGVRYSGAIGTKNLPQGQYSLKVMGTTDKIELETIRYQGKNGQLNATGTLAFNSIIKQTKPITDDTPNNQQSNNVDFNTVNSHDNNYSHTNNDKIIVKSDKTKNGSAENLSWQVQADLSEFDFSFITTNIPAILTGQLNTSGRLNTASGNNNNNQNNNQAIQALEAFSIKFDGDLKTKALPTGKLLLDAHLDTKADTTAIVLNQLSHKSESGSIHALGNIHLPTTKDNKNKSSIGYQWDINSQMQGFNLGYFNAKMPSNLTGEVTTSGNWNKHKQQLQLDLVNLSGQLKEHELTAQGQLYAELRLPNDLTTFTTSLKEQSTEQQYNQVRNIIDTLTLTNLNAKWNDNEVTASGTTDALIAKLNITNLTQLHKKLTGQLSGEIRISTDSSIDSKALKPTNRPVPNIYIDLTANAIGLPNFKVEKAIISGKVSNLLQDSSQLDIDIDNLVSGKHTFKKLAISFIGTQTKHDLQLSVDSKQLQVLGQFIGGIDDNAKWEGHLTGGKIISDGVHLLQTDASKLSIDMLKTSGQQLKIKAHCWQDKYNKSKLCLHDDLLISQDRGHFDVDLKALDSSLLQFAMPDKTNWQGKMSGNARLHWQKGTKPQIKLMLSSDQGLIGMNQEEDNPISMPYRRISLIALSTKNGLKIRTDMNIDGKAHSFAEVIIDPYQKSKPISGVLSVNNLNLAIFKPFFSGMRRLGGIGSLKANITGTLKKPLINGTLQLKGGYLSMIGLPMSLSAINAKAKISSTQMKVDGSFYSGKGRGNINGTVDWQKDLQIKIGITGKNLNISEPPLLSAKVDPDISIVIKPRQKYVVVKGVVSIPNAVIRPPESNADVVSKSTEVTVLDRRATDNIDEVFAMAAPWSINADIGIDLGEQVSFKGFGADLPLAGAMILTQRGQGQLTGQGVIQVSRRNTIEAFGQRVELEYAQIRFDSDILNPNISVTASKKISNNKVGFTVKGNAKNPKITVFNDAGLNEQQAMTALVTGRLNDNGANNQVSAEGFRSKITNNLAAAGLSLGLDTTRGITNEIGQAVGLQKLILSASGNSSDTNINITGYITPDLYIRYAFGVFNAQSQLSARYQLTQRIYLEATSATEKFVDLVYGWNF